MISILITALIFALAAYGVWWVCVHFQLPKPVLYACGAVLLIVLLIILLRLVNVAVPPVLLR